MARGTLHAPKPDGQRRRRNAAQLPERIVVRDGVVRGPDLAALTGRSDWSVQTLAWYETWRSSAQAQAFESTDWLRLAFLAPLVEAYWRCPDKNLLAEIRLNEERLGATYVDRQRARIRVVAPDAAAPVEDAALQRAVAAREEWLAAMGAGELGSLEDAEEFG